MKRLLLIFAIAVTLASCDSSSDSGKARIAKGDVVLGGTLRVTEAERPAGLAPEDMVTASAQRIGNQVHCGLLRLDPETQAPMPAIAERVEPDTSGRIYIFHLRQNARFHNEPCFGSGSRDVTAQDVAFSFQRLCRAESQAYETTFKGRVEGAEAYHEGTAEDISGIMVLDDYTLRISLTKADESFLFVLAQPSTAIISRKAWDDCGQVVVGAGPFVPVDGEGDLILLRNPDYFATDAFDNQLPYVDSVTVSFIPTKELALEKLLQGGLDLVTGVYLDPVKMLMEQHAAEFMGKEAKFVMQRNDDAASFEVYSVHTSKLIGFRENFLGHRDYSVVQMGR